MGGTPQAAPSRPAPICLLTAGILYPWGRRAGSRSLEPALGSFSNPYLMIFSLFH